MGITGHEVQVTGWMIKHLPAELLQEICWLSSVIMQQDNTSTRNTMPLVLNGLHYANHFPLLEFCFAGRSTVTPMHWLLLGFWGNVYNPHFIIFDDLVQKLIAVIMVLLLKCQCWLMLFAFCSGVNCLAPTWCTIFWKTDAPWQCCATRSGKSLGNDCWVL